MSSALRNVKGSFHYSVVPSSELELKAHVHIKIMYSNLVETTSFLTLGPLGIIVRQIHVMHSVKLGYLVCAVTVHLLLFLFECHCNKEYVRAVACVRAYVPVRVI